MAHNRLAGAASMALGFGIAVNALLGPLVFGVIKLRNPPTWKSAPRRGDHVTVIAAPLAFAGGILWWRGNALAPFIAIGPAGFALYNYVQFVLVPDYSRYAGNNECFFPLYLTLVILAWALIWRAWHALGRGELRRWELARVERLGDVRAPRFGVCARVARHHRRAARGRVDHRIRRASDCVLARSPHVPWFVIPLGLLVGIGLLRRLAGAIAAHTRLSERRRFSRARSREWRFVCGFAAIRRYRAAPYHLDGRRGRIHPAVRADSADCSARVSRAAAWS